MDEYASESDSDYTSYWRDWVSRFSDLHLVICSPSLPIHPICCHGAQYSSAGVGADGVCRPMAGNGEDRERDALVTRKQRKKTGKHHIESKLTRRHLRSSSHLEAMSTSARSMRTT